MAIVSRWLVVALLVCVALGQFVRAHVDTLSPWKGGGFGMFAAIDSPGMRIVSAVGIDAEGLPHRLDPLASLSGARRRHILAYPRERDLQELARELVEDEFVPTGAKVTSALEQLQAQNPDARLGLRYPSRFSGPVYRVRKDGDPNVPAAQMRRFETVIVESWRLQFDARDTRLTVTPLLPAVRAERGRADVP